MKGILVKGFEQLAPELADAEACLGRALGSSVPFIDGLGRFLHRAKGKRLRPALVLLLYKLLGARGPREEVLELAAVIELIHLATLVHDDVIDRADTRRSQPTLHVYAGNRIAVLEGDYLFVQVFKTINRFGRPTRDLVIRTVERILEGELLQESLRGQVPSEAAYREAITGKTAVLLAAACAIGVQWGDPDLPEEARAAAYEAGLLMGQAFQLVDDLLDVFGTADELGKPAWSDLRGGWLTLPLIRLLAARPDLRARVQADPHSGEVHAELSAALVTTGERARLEAEADGLLRAARRKLDWLPPGELRQTLFETIDFIAKRRT